MKLTAGGNLLGEVDQGEIFRTPEKAILVIFLVDTVHRLTYHQLCKIQRILCQKRDFIPNQS